MRKVAVLIDGGHVRACAARARQTFTPALIVRVAKAAVADTEELFRIQYYDCDPFAGTVKLPVSGRPKVYPGGHALLAELARLEQVAVRRGVLKFRGWERTPASLKLAKQPSDLEDGDFRAKWEQKGVDLRIGLDIVTMTETRAADLIVLVTGDTDLVPALKLARGRGLQVAGLDLPNQAITPELKPHLDFYRRLATWA